MRRQAGTDIPLQQWLGVRFLCAGAYMRALKRPDGSGYDARCPRCGKVVLFTIGEGGTNTRFFEVRC